MRTAGRWRRWGSWLVRWGGLGAALVIVAVFAASSVGRLSWAGPRSSVQIGQGCLSGAVWTVSDPDIAILFPPGWRLRGPERTIHGRYPPIVWRPSAWRGNAVAYMRIPLWMPLVLTVAGSGIAWTRRLRRARPGLCPACGYSMAGNTTGVCPECGAGRP